jgi:hypothetical protein
MKKIWLLFLFWFLFSARSVEASKNISITTDSSALSYDQEMVIYASASGFATDEAIFVKGAFFYDGSSNYFGYTKMDDFWIKNSASVVNQLKINLSDWDRKLNVKSDFADSGFKGNGNYKFKVGFYYFTSGGNVSSVNWSTNTLDVYLTSPTVTPSPTPIPTVKSLTPTLKPIGTIAQSPQPTDNFKVNTTFAPSALPKEDKPSVQPIQAQEVLGEESSISTPTNPQKIQTPNNPDENKNVYALILIFFGSVLILGAIFFILKKYNRAGVENDILNNDENEND